MKKLPLHDLLINQGLVQELMDKKESGVKYIAMDEDQRIFAYFKEVKCVARSNGKMMWGDPDNIGSYIFIAEPKDSKIDHTASCEKIDWDYLTATGSSEPEYNMEKLGDVYKALLNGNIIKTWGGFKDDLVKYVKFDSATQEFLYSSDGCKTFHLVSLSPNNMFNNVCEIYKKPTERLWIKLTYDPYTKEVATKMEYLDIEKDPTTLSLYKKYWFMGIEPGTKNYGVDWVKTGIVR